MGYTNYRGLEKMKMEYNRTYFIGGRHGLYIGEGVC